MWLLVSYQEGQQPAGSGEEGARHISCRWADRIDIYFFLGGTEDWLNDTILMECNPIIIDSS